MPQQHIDKETGNVVIVHDLEVLMSAAGYYIGSLYTETKPDGEVIIDGGRYSRDSGYFKTREKAEKWLKDWTFNGG